MLYGLRTEFIRKLDLTVVAIPPKAGTEKLIAAALVMAGCSGLALIKAYGASPMAVRPNPFKFRA